MKEMKAEHVEDAGGALFTAFYGDSLATDVPPTGGLYVHVMEPLFVSLSSSDRGAGKALMRSLVEHAHKVNAPSIRRTMVSSTRKMEEADVEVCAEIYKRGMGYDRDDDIKAMLPESPERCWVGTTEDNPIL